MNARPPIPGPLGLGDLLDRAFRLYRARFMPFLITSALFLVPFSLISGLLTGRFITGYMDALGAVVESTNAPPETFLSEFFGSVGNFLGSMLLMGILGLLINAVVTLALANHSIAALHDETMTLREGLRRGLRRFWAFVWMNILQALGIGLATLAIVIVLVVAVAAIAFIGAAVGSAAFDSNNVFATIALVLVLVCGYVFAVLLVLAPALYLSARWVAATPALVAEDLGATGALKRSWQLTHGRVWRAIGYVVLLYLITAIVVSLPVGLIQQILIVALPSSALAIATLFSTALSSLFSVVWTPLYVCAIVLLYYDLRVRSEGYDLDLRVQQLEASLQDGEQPAL